MLLSLQSSFLLRRILPLFCLGGILCAQNLTIVSGNGQIVPEQTLSNAPMVVQATDASGHPVAGAAITWSITQGSGTLSNPSPATDSNGLASSNFVGTSLVGDSFGAATVTVSSASGSVNFTITTVIDSNGGVGASVDFILPAPDATLVAMSGSTLPGAVKVSVSAASGFEVGMPIPNVSLRILNGQDPTLPPAASCNGPEGVVLTDSTGTATCDLVVSGSAGTFDLRPLVGEYQSGYPFTLQITPGASCSYSLSSSSQSFGSTGGSGTLNVITTAGCSWSAASNASWISITAGSSGTGNGTVSYSVAADSGSSRTGTLTIAGRTYSVSQTGTTTGGGLAVATANLPAGTVNVAYSATLSATGGQPPYSWSTSGSLPAGLTLNGTSGVISGTPSAAGTSNFSATVQDSAGASASQNLSITINGVTSSSFAITTTSFANGAVGQPYQQTITTVNANTCAAISSVVTFTVSAGALPSGLSIQGATIAGTPTLPGTFSFTLMAVSQCGTTASASLKITITGTAPLMTVSPSLLLFTVQQGATNIPANQQIAITSSGAAFSYVATASTNSGGNWLTITSSTSGTTPGSVTAGVVNYSSLAPGAYIGSISISSQASNSPVSVPVTLTILAAVPLTASPSTFAVNQFATPGSNVALQSISVTSGSNSTSFSAAAATANGGPWLSISPTSGSTPATLTAAINSGGLATGTYTGSIVITPATGAVQTISVALVVSQQPPSISSIQNAASFVLGPVSPGEIVTIFGSAIGPTNPSGLQLTANGTVSTNVASTSILFNGVAAPLLYTSASQVSAVVPYEVAGSTTTKVQLSYLGLVSNVLNVQVAAAAPGIFTVNSSGSGQGAILNQDGSVNSTSNGAAPGSVISIFATGEGQTNPPGMDGAINATTLPLPAPLVPVTVQIAGQPAQVTYYGAAPGELAGVLQVNAVVPANLQPGVPVTVTITVGATSSQTVTLMIKL